MSTFTLVDEGRAEAVDATIEGERVRVGPDALGAALGWELKPQGFCKDDICYPVPGAGDLVTAGGVDVAGFAKLIGRAVAVDAGEGAAYIGSSARERAERLASLEAPDFTLPDLEGRMHSLSDFRGRKVLLAAYGSW